jgi:ETC complex I subunit conserved region
MRARIYQRPKNAMQSGRAGTQEWILEFEPAEPRRADPLMGWIGSSDTLAQVTLQFATREEAEAYAQKNGIPFDLALPPPSRALKPKAYADNFRFGRMENWTH